MLCFFHLNYSYNYIWQPRVLCFDAILTRRVDARDQGIMQTPRAHCGPAAKAGPRGRVIFARFRWTFGRPALRRRQLRQLITVKISTRWRERRAWRRGDDGSERGGREGARGWKTRDRPAVVTFTLLIRKTRGAYNDYSPTADRRLIRRGCRRPRVYNSFLYRFPSPTPETRQIQRVSRADRVGGGLCEVWVNGRWMGVVRQDAQRSA